MTRHHREPIPFDAIVQAYVFVAKRYRLTTDDLLRFDNHEQNKTLLVVRDAALYAIYHAGLLNKVHLGSVSRFVGANESWLSAWCLRRSKKRYAEDRLFAALVDEIKEIL